MRQNSNDKEVIIYDKKITTIDAIWVFILCAVVASLVATIVSGVVLALIRIAFGLGVNITHNKYAICFQYLMVYVTMFYFLYLYVKKKRIALRHEVQLTKAKQTSSIFYSIGFALLCLAICIPFISLIEHGFSLVGYHPASESLPLKSFWDFILNIVFVAFLPAVVEEIVYRGVILKGFEQKCKPWVAILITSFVFMLAHGSLEQCVYQFILGLILTYIAYSTGNILYSMIAHFTNNFVVILLSYIQNNTTPWVINFSNAINVVWVVLLFVLGGALLVTVLYVWTKRVLRKETTTTGVMTQNGEQVEIVSKKWSKEEVLFFLLGLGIMLAIWILGTVAGF